MSTLVRSKVVRLSRKQPHMLAIDVSYFFRHSKASDVKLNPVSRLSSTHATEIMDIKNNILEILVAVFA
jgi:hypothetical protein